MKLIFDIGNTNIVCAVFSETELTLSFRLQSNRERTEDEFSSEVFSLLRLHSIDHTKVTEVIIGSVVPQLTRVFSKLSEKYFKRQPRLLESGDIRVIQLNVESPSTVGIDRIANSFAAFKKYGEACIVVDLGTATTFDIVGPTGSYDGGIIAPGLKISADALFSRAALLQSIELKLPEKLIGKNTKDAMLSGILFGYASLIEGLIARLKTELGTPVKVIATGGFAEMVSQLTTSIDFVDSELTLTGFRLLADQPKGTAAA